MGQEQSTQAAADDNARRNILLVGTSGRGKSATGNLIFGSNVFETSDSTGTDPDHIVCKSREVMNGLKINICDALTIPDVRMLKSEMEPDIKARLKKCIDYCPEGFHFIIFVFNYDNRITEEDLAAVDVLKKECGHRFFTEQVIFVFTHGETFEMQQMFNGGPNFDTWYRNSTDALLQKVYKNNVKAFLIKNAQKEIMETQRQELMRALRNCHRCALGLQKKNVKGLDETYGATRHHEERVLSVNNSTNLLLLGCVGNGKSSTANTILGQKRFRVCEGMSDVGTIMVAVASTRINGQTVAVVDTPGITSPNTREIINQNLHEGFKHCPDGFNALVLVLQYGKRFTDEEKKTVSFLKEMLGENIIRKNCILVFTHGESFMPNANNAAFENWCQQQTGALEALIDECGHRVVLFCNLKPEKKEESVQRLDVLARTCSKFSFRPEYEHVSTARRPVTGKFCSRGGAERSSRPRGLLDRARSFCDIL